VGTLTPWRGKGIASALLRRAIEVMEATNCDVSGLHGMAAASAMYRKLGWVPASSPVCEIDVSVSSSVTSLPRPSVEAE
jgi:predicted acetyltransferase